MPASLSGVPVWPRATNALPRSAFSLISGAIVSQRALSSAAVEPVGAVDDGVAVVCGEAGGASPPVLTSDTTSAAADRATAVAIPMPASSVRPRRGRCT